MKVFPLSQILLLPFLFLLPVDTLACSCVFVDEPLSVQVEKAKTRADAVFSGKVLEIVQASRGGNIQVRLKVNQQWKATLSDEVTVATGSDSGDCGYPFRLNKTYLVYASNTTMYSSTPQLSTHICFRTGPLADAKADLDILGGQAVPVAPKTEVFSVSPSGGQPNETKNQINETDFLIARFEKPDHVNRLQSAMWTVTHDYKDFKKMSEKLEYFQAFLEALGKYQQGEKGTLDKLGGVIRFKDTLGTWLNDDDQAIRAFAAVLIGISGDKRLAPQLWSFLERRKPKPDELVVYDRSVALTALGLLNDVDSKERIAAYISSKDDHDHYGAINALAYLKATEYAPRIAKLLVSKAALYDDDASPIHFLVETRTAKDYKKEIASVMLSTFKTETLKAAMYALVSLDAKEYSGKIALLLNDRFKKGEAAKALSLLGASQYSNRIAALLKDESGLVRAAAALSLGVMKSKRHSNALQALILWDKETYVRNYAAVALVLMEAKQHYKEALPLARPHTPGFYLTDSAFHPFVEERSRELTVQLKQALDSLPLL